MERRGSGQPSGIGVASPRKHQSFPACVTDILEQVTKVCGQQGQKWRGPAALRNNELQYQLDNDLFCISPDRRVSRLNQIQQLRLMQILCDYFKERECEPRGHQYSYFEAIFCGREGEPLLHETRISLLINLCSLAVQYPCYSVLNHISQWLHKIGSGKSYAQQFVSQLVDHYIFIPDDFNLYKYLLPLADEVPEFVSYFVAYSVTKDSLRQSLFMVLNHWLTGQRGDLIMAFIKETPIVTKHFASVTFPYMVVYDCCIGGISKNPLHGFTVMLYAEWKIFPSLELRPALEMIAYRSLTTTSDSIRSC
ncbi:Integrator complex subunit [Dirofilaria immitis]